MDVKARNNSIKEDEGRDADDEEPMQIAPSLSAGKYAGMRRD